jgi:hypothetical protein
MSPVRARSARYRARCFRFPGWVPLGRDALPRPSCAAGLLCRGVIGVAGRRARQRRCRGSWACDVQCGLGAGLAAAGARFGRDRPRLRGVRVCMGHLCRARLLDARFDPHRSGIPAAGSGALHPTGRPGLRVGGAVQFTPFHGSDDLALGLRRGGFDLSFRFLGLRDVRAGACGAAGSNAGWRMTGPLSLLK